MSKIPIWLTISLFLYLLSPLYAATVTVKVESSGDLSTWDDTNSEGPQTVSSPKEYFRASISAGVPGDESYSDVVEISSSGLEERAVVQVQASTDLTNWDDSTTGDHDITGGKKFFRVDIKSIILDMVTVEGGTVPNTTFTVEPSFEIGRYEVTKELWDAVYLWATDADNPNRYFFFEGLSGDPTTAICTDHPVAGISWYDAVKWCNALSEIMGLTAVYYHADTTTIYRGVTGSENLDNLNVQLSNSGYRLPTETEWVFASVGGTLSQGYAYSGGDVLNDVAVNIANSFGSDCYPDANGSFPVGSKIANELGLYDMSGNVWEYYTDFNLGSDVRYCRGGSWEDSLPLFFQPAGFETQSTQPTSQSNFGFRLAMSLPVPAVAAASLPEEQIVASSTTTPGKSKNTKPLKPAKVK